MEFESFVLLDQQAESGFEFWWDLELDLLLDFGLDSGGFGLDLQDEFGESFVFLGQEDESALDFRTNFVLSNNFMSSCLLRGDFVNSDFTQLDIILSLNEVPMNFPDGMI